MRKCRQVKTSLSITTNGRSVENLLASKTEYRVQSTEYLFPSGATPNSNPKLIPSSHPFAQLNPLSGLWLSCLFDCSPPTSHLPYPFHSHPQPEAKPRVSRISLLLSKLNFMPVPPIGLAVTNTADIVIVNYVRDFLHLIFYLKRKKYRSPKGKIDLLACKSWACHVVSHNFYKWWAHVFNNFFSASAIFSFTYLRRSFSECPRVATVETWWKH